MDVNEKSQTSTARGIEEGGQPVHDSDSRGGTEAIGGGFWDLNVGTGGEDRTWDDPSLRGLLGGILAQLLKAEENRLSETEECIVWYQREREKAESRIQELKQLQKLAQASVNPIADATPEKSAEEE